MCSREKKTLQEPSNGPYTSTVELYPMDEPTINPKDHLAIDVSGSELWGWPRLKSRCLQWLNNPKWFLFFLMLFGILQGMSINTFVNTSIHSIEKQFSLNSKQSGFIAASNEITSLLFVPFVSFYGGYSHKARLLGYGSLVTGLGALLFVLPSFLIGRYDPSGGAVGMKEFCSLNGTTNKNYLECHRSETPSEVYFFIFVMSQLMSGAGACPLFTLGPSFLDENVRPKHLPIYLGFFYSCIMLGPGVGATVAGKVLSLYVNLKQPPGLNLTEKDPRWIGAWWLGNLSAGLALLLVGLILLGYPRELPGARAIREEAIKSGILPPSDQRFQGKLRDILPAAKSLLRNATYMFQNMAVTVGILVAVGIAPFFFKVMQGKFGASAFATGLALSLITAVGGCGGFALGSFVVRRLGLKNSCEKAAKWSFILQVVAVFFVVAFLIPGCENSTILGVHVPYYNSTLQKGSLTSACNSKCHCSQSTFNPVCGPGNALYFSPCHAGCKTRLLGRRRFGNCSCVQQPGNSSRAWTSLVGGEVTPGMCDRKCKNLFVFAVVFVVVLMVSFSNAVPSKTVTLRSVAENQRPLALGLQFVFQRALGMLPGPIIFGHLMDSTCQVWRVKCGNRSSCADYDYDKFSLYVVAFGVPVAILSILFYFLSWHFCKKTSRALDGVNNQGNEVKLSESKKEFFDRIDSVSCEEGGDNRTIEKQEIGHSQEIELEEDDNENREEMEEATG